MLKLSRATELEEILDVIKGAPATANLNQDNKHSDTFSPARSFTAGNRITNHC